VGEYEYELHERACLGHGAFGAVYKGRQRNVRQSSIYYTPLRLALFALQNPDLPVAVKRIKKCQAHAKGQAALEKEMEILKVSTSTFSSTVPA
jgi:predicted Ser/Thr protein kinase